MAKNQTRKPPQDITKLSTTETDKPAYRDQHQLRGYKPRARSAAAAGRVNTIAGTVPAISQPADETNDLSIINNEAVEKNTYQSEPGAEGADAAMPVPPVPAYHKPAPSGQ
jgi:hypothetical protein